MKCPECRQAQMETRRENYRYVESGLPNVVIADAEIRVCPACGARAVAIPRMEELHRMLAMAVIQQAGPLAPHEIRFLRKWLGWSGVDFAKHMGVAPETVSRWESAKDPKSMGPTADRLLRVLVARSRPVEEYPTGKLAELDDKAERPGFLRATASRGGWQVAAAA